MPKQALIMIDMQRGFLDSASPLCIPSAEATVPACAALIDRCHAAGVPVIYAVRHYRSDGSDVEKPRAAAWAAGGKPLSEDCAAHLSDAFPDAFTVLPQDYVLVKPRFSAFFHTGLDLILRRLGVQTVLLAGTTTPNCIRTTCYDAISLDYDAVVLSDCTSSVTDAVQAANLADMQRVVIDLLDIRRQMVRQHGAHARLVTVTHELFIEPALEADHVQRLLQALDLCLHPLGLLHKERVPLGIRVAALRAPLHELPDLPDLQSGALEALDHAQRLELLLAEAAGT